MMEKSRYYLLALVVTVLDQLTKYWIEQILASGEPWVVTSFFKLALAYNTGAAFSFLSEAGGWQQWLFGGIALVASVVMIVWIYRLPKGDRLQGMAVALILGGAMGNLYDRVTVGYVIDFVVLHYKDFYWPAFNLADSAITAGAAILIVLSFFNQSGVLSND